MNSHYQSYSDISSSHSPSPDNNNYTTVALSSVSGNAVNTSIAGGVRSNGNGINGSGNSTQMIHQLQNGHHQNPNSQQHHSQHTSQQHLQPHQHHHHQEHHPHHQSNPHGQQPLQHHHHHPHIVNISGDNDTGGGGGGSGGGAGNGNSGSSNCSGGNNGTTINGVGIGQPNFHHQLNNSLIKYCAGCGGKIVERFFLHALDRYWHNSCLKCYCCGALLADIGSSCFTRAGLILCKTDYTRMFGSSQCSACGQIIAANEFVMRTSSSVNNHQQQNMQHQQSPPVGNATNSAATNGGMGNGGVIDPHLQPKNFLQTEVHVFHLKCFACSKCSSQLRPGDRYYMLAGSLVCEQDWHKLLKSSANPPVRKGKVGRPRRSRD